MTQIKEAVFFIAKTLEHEYGFKIPGSFTPEGDYRDIVAFIDIESLFLKDFRFLNQNANRLQIEELYRIDKNSFAQKDITQLFPSGQTEEKDIGMGYAQNSAKGKGPTLPEAIEIKSMLNDADPIEHKTLYIKAKAAGKLKGVDDDKVTDFFVKIKKQELMKVTKKLIADALEQSNYSFTADGIITEMKSIYIKNTNVDAFPFAAPLEIVEDKWLTLGQEFRNVMLTDFLYSIGISLPSEYSDLKGSTKKNKYIEENYAHLIYTDKANDYFYKRISDEFEKINDKLKYLSSINDLSKMENSWSLLYALRNKEVLERIGLEPKKVLISYEEYLKPATYFINKSNELIIIQNRVSNYDNLLEMVQQIDQQLIERGIRFSSYKIFLNQDEAWPTVDFGKFRIYDKSEYWK